MKSRGERREVFVVEERYTSTGFCICLCLDLNENERINWACLELRTEMKNNAAN